MIGKQLGSNMDLGDLSLSNAFPNPNSYPDIEGPCDETCICHITVK